MTGPGELSASATMQLITIGRMHYLEGLSFVEISRRLDVNRFKIARLCSEARDRGLVQITVAAPASIDLEHSDMLRRAWPDLEEAIVVPTPGPDSPVTLKGRLAEVAAALMMERTTADDVVGLACGRTVNLMAAQITKLPPCSIVQLTGVTSSGSVSDSSIRTMQRVAALSRGRSYPIYAPMLLESAGLVESLRREPAIASAFDHFHRLTRAVVTVGAWKPGDSTMHSYPTRREHEELHRQGVVAEFTGHLLDEDGQVVGKDFTARCITVPLDDLRRVPELTVVVGGADRVPAIRAALRGGLIRHLITDSKTAVLLAEASSII